MSTAAENVALLPVSNLTARELLRVADRSHPHVEALAIHLERLMDSLDALKRRLEGVSEEAESCAVRVDLVSRLPTFAAPKDSG